MPQPLRCPQIPQCLVDLVGVCSAQTPTPVQGTVQSFCRAIRPASTHAQSTVGRSRGCAAKSTTSSTPTETTGSAERQRAVAGTALCQPVARCRLLQHLQIASSARPILDILGPSVCFSISRIYCATSLKTLLIAPPCIPESKKTEAIPRQAAFGTPGDQGIHTEKHLKAQASKDMTVKPIYTSHQWYMAFRNKGAVPHKEHCRDPS